MNRHWQGLHPDSYADKRALYVASETTTTAADNRPSRGSLRALGREAGVTIWMKTLPMPIHGGLALSEKNIFAGTSDGGFYSFQKETGEIVWFVQIGSAFNCIPVIAEHAGAAQDGTKYEATGNGIVYVGSEDGSLFPLDESTGKIRWRY